jgi:glutamate synthase (ferredoxin)
MPDVPVRKVNDQDHALERSLDVNFLLDAAKPALERQEPVKLAFPIQNVNRTVGTILGSDVTRAYGNNGLPDDTIDITFNGSAGQSFGAFVPAGMTLRLEGDANDYFGKGLSGGKLIVFPPKEATFVAEESIVIGNVALYGATSGSAFIRGVAGERFAVRNSGAYAVVEGLGDHGCEYMTGGRVVVIGETGRNFGAGMSGGIAYVWDPKGEFPARCNMEMILLEKLEDSEELDLVQGLVERHREYTGSTLAAKVLKDWPAEAKRFVKVMPREYKRALAEQRAELERKQQETPAAPSAEPAGAARG